MRKAIVGVSLDVGSHGSAVSTACSNSPVSPNSWRTNREAEAAEAAYHYNKEQPRGGTRKTGVSSAITVGLEAQE